MSISNYRTWRFELLTNRGTVSTSMNLHAEKASEIWKHVFFEGAIQKEKAEIVFYNGLASQQQNIGQWRSARFHLFLIVLFERMGVFQSRAGAQKNGQTVDFVIAGDLRYDEEKLATLLPIDASDSGLGEKLTKLLEGCNSETAEIRHVILPRTNWKDIVEKSHLDFDAELAEWFIVKEGEFFRILTEEPDDDPDVIVVHPADTLSEVLAILGHELDEATLKREVGMLIKPEESQTSAKSAPVRAQPPTAQSQSGQMPVLMGVIIGAVILALGAYLALSFFGDKTPKQPLMGDPVVEIETPKDEDDSEAKLEEIAKRQEELEKRLKEEQRARKKKETDDKNKGKAERIKHKPKTVTSDTPPNRPTTPPPAEEPPVEEPVAVRPPAEEPEPEAAEKAANPICTIEESDKGDKLRCPSKQLMQRNFVREIIMRKDARGYPIIECYCTNGQEKMQGPMLGARAIAVTSWCPDYCKSVVQP